MILTWGDASWAGSPSLAGEGGVTPTVTISRASNLSNLFPPAIENEPVVVSHLAVTVQPAWRICSATDRAAALVSPEKL